MSYTTNFQGNHDEFVHDDEYANLVYSTLSHFEPELDLQILRYVRELEEQDGVFSTEERLEEIKSLRHDAFFFFFPDVLDEVLAVVERMDSKKVGEVVLAAVETHLAFNSACGTLDPYQYVAYETARAIMLRMPTYEEWLAVNPNPEDSTNDVKEKEATA